MIRPAWIVMLAGALAATVGPATAHGDQQHSQNRIDYSKAEEKSFGRAADPKTARRIVRIDMSDAMRFTPAEIEVRQNDTVRFDVKNSGRQLHEMVLGTMEDLKAHAALMRKHPGMEHDEPWMAHVAPGKTGTIGWRFSKPGTYYYGCLIQGHFEAGMIGKVTVK